MINHWQPIAQTASAIAADRLQAQDIRVLAAATLDLIGLVATWPLARWHRFDDHLAYSVLRLCRCTGQRLCGDGRCPADETPTGPGGCPVIRDRLALIDSFGTGLVGG